jgi:hypothetical protein
MKEEAIVKHFQNNEHHRITEAVKKEVQKNLSNVKSFLDLAIFSVVQSMRIDPNKYSSLVYSNNPRLLSTSTRGNISNNYKYMSSGQQQPLYDYKIEDIKSGLLDQAEEFYTSLVDRLVCEVINGSITEQPAAESPPALPLEAGNKQEEQTDLLPKDEQ